MTFEQKVTSAKLACEGAVSALLEFIKTNPEVYLKSEDYLRENLIEILKKAGASEEIAKYVTGLASLGSMVLNTNILNQLADPERN